LLMLCISASVQGQITLPSSGYISTIAGNGTYGFSGDGGPATSAEFRNPYGVAVDTSGNLYISETGGHRIRKVTASTGIITTVAGNGYRDQSGDGGYSGDGGAATSAELNEPWRVVVDSAGNLYIADTGNFRIRKVTASTGIITTVAGNGTQGFSGDGGLATSAELTLPYGVTVDTAGNIYFTDSGRIRKVAVSTGIITTVAGNGTRGFSGDGGPATSAEFNNTADVAVDASGNLYIADAQNNCIRKVTASTGIITTVAGNGTQGFSGDGGPATSAALYNPEGLTVDSIGNLYIADLANNRIRMVAASTGIITTVAGDGTYAFSGDGGLATSAELRKPMHVKLDTSGNLYILDAGNYRVRAVGAPQVTPTITWPTPAAIAYGTALSATQLNATASVPGTFDYSPAAGTVLSVGTHTLSVTFTPTDTTRYSTVTATVQITVNDSALGACQAGTYTVTVTFNPSNSSLTPLTGTATVTLSPQN
jgi:hypothetical protein